MFINNNVQQKMQLDIVVMSRRNLGISFPGYLASGGNLFAKLKENFYFIRLEEYFHTILKEMLTKFLGSFVFFSSLDCVS